MAASARKQIRLGMIVPTIRPGRKPDDPMMLGETGEYQRWLVDHGIDWVDIRFAESFTTGTHAPESVWQTGGLDVLIPPARELAEAGCDAVAWPCTCASFIGGLDWSRNQAAELSNATGLPTTSTSLALLAAIATFGAKTVDVMSPYPPPVTEAFERFLSEAGIEVAATAVLDCADDSISIKLDLLREAKRFVDGLPDRAHLLVVPDTAVYSLNAVAKTEAELESPVVAANQATLWHCLKLLDIECHASDAGLLFDGASEPERRIASS